MTRQFDAITYAQELEAAGVPKAQAEVHAKALAYALNDSVVLPEQLAAVEQKLNGRIDALGSALRAEMREMEARLRGEMQAIEARLNARIDRLEERIKYMMWMNGLTLALVVGMLVKSWLG
ncbi:MAG TPA: hypothetical protein VNT33_05680 [Telluria sp.]|nr:hypothetical protein [Telluria sp.]